VVEGPARDMDSNRAELRAAIAALKAASAWKGKVKLWIDNKNVMRGLQRLAEGIQPEDLIDDEWRESTGLNRGYTENRWMRESQDRDMWEVAVDLVKLYDGRLTLGWQRGHQDVDRPKHLWTKHEAGNIEADRICNLYKKKAAPKERLIMPRKHSWRLCWRGVELVGPWRQELREKFDIMMVVHHFAEVRGWGTEVAEQWLGEDVSYWRMKGRSVAQRVAAAKCMYSMWETEDVKVKRRQGQQPAGTEQGPAAEVCAMR